MSRVPVRLNLAQSSHRMTLGSTPPSKKKEDKGAQKGQEREGRLKEKEGNEKEVGRAREMEGVPRIETALDKEMAAAPVRQSIEEEGNKTV
jgi:hypothetical protein